MWVSRYAVVALPEAVDIAEGKMCGPFLRGSIAQPWSKTLSSTVTLDVGSDIVFGQPHSGIGGQLMEAMR
jgi:hypothetical protein